MGVPSAEKLAKEQQRAIAEGADPDWVKKMDGGRTGVLGVMQFSETVLSSPCASTWTPMT